MNYTNFFIDCMHEMMRPKTAGNYDDYRYLDTRANLPEMDETKCQACGETLESKADNVGFSENPKTEIEYYCKNGCIQDERVTIL